jgi:hypothetical protein
VSEQPGLVCLYLSLVLVKSIHFLPKSSSSFQWLAPEHRSPCQRHGQIFQSRHMLIHAVTYAYSLKQSWYRILFISRINASRVHRCTLDASSHPNSLPGAITGIIPSSKLCTLYFCYQSFHTYAWSLCKPPSEYNYYRIDHRENARKSRLRDHLEAQFKQLEFWT